MTYDDATGTLDIGERSGSYPGMLEQRTFVVVLVSPDNSVGFDVDATPMGTELSYDGTAVAVTL
jgi:alpha-D-xyloside xylohydrolase